MLFNSLTFLLFFAGALGVCYVLPSWPWRKRWLLLVSYVFYAAWYAPYVAILAFSTTMDWWLARRIARTEVIATRKALLVLSLVSNLGLLGFFKYGGFIVDNVGYALDAAGIAHFASTWNVLLPIGISFYTFASLSYTIDVYRRDIDGNCAFLDYALFVSFFPHLVAGPIVRARLLLPQFAQARTTTRDQFVWGLVLTLIGLVCKTVFADTVFAPAVDIVYAQPEHHGALETWAAVFGFSGQIYFDFAGYSLCAIGIALCFGFAFPDNFRHPYAARSFSEFWQRWHITLSSWLRDYLYIPLGGNRGSRAAMYRNLMLTMLLGGLWHGAAWTFVLWGALHGFYLVLEHATRSRGGKVAPAWRAMVVFLVVTLTWIPFRAADVTSVETILRNLADFSNASSARVSTWLSLGGTLAMLVWQNRYRDCTLEQRFALLGEAGQVGVVAALLIALFLCSGGDERAFIYFQF